VEAEMIRVLRETGRSVREKADAQWGDTTEGKVCVAAHNAAMSTYRSPRDGKAYHGGNK
jgi:hypothetical protein